MFSNSVNGTPGTAPSRRRPRPLSSENSVTQPKAKRARNTFNEQTFVAPNDAPEMVQARPENAVATLQDRLSADLSNHLSDLTVRTKKRRVVTDRTSKGDGSTILTSNEIYTVSRLPALPDRLRTHNNSPQHGAIYSDSGYALSLSHTHAVVWPYSVNSAAPEIFTFTLPQASKNHYDALPLGTLVSASASEHEPGLVVVMPTTGKICYWESISSAATLDLIRKKQNGLEGSVPGQMSGETVIQILNAETAGFVLAFSSGRLAYLSVRDGQGRPAISVQFLPTGSGPRGGIFGSMRNLLAGAWGGDIAAIRAGPSTKIGERDVVMATSKGKLQAWELHRGGHNSIRANLDLRDQIVDALVANNPEMQDLPLEAFEILDLAFSTSPASSRQSIGGSTDGLNLFLLTSMTSGSRSYYALVELTLGNTVCDMDRIIAITSYNTPVNSSAVSKPRIYLPSPGHVAFLVFDRSVVIVSMAKKKDTPDMQLMSDDTRLRVEITFEDVVDFRNDLDLEIIGSGEEEPYGPSHGEDHKSRKHRAKFPATVLLVRNRGLIRIAVTNTRNLMTSVTGRLPAKSKLEQAVFFRTLENNPLSFATRPELQFEADKVGKAAKELSIDIIDSNTRHVPSVSAALDQHLGKRASALRSLADHLKEQNIAVDREVRWTLMADAERLNGALLMWKTYETAMKAKPAGQKEGLLTQIVELIPEDQKTEPIKENGEVDRVRFWFLKDISRISNVIPWTVQAVRLSATEQWEDSLGLAKMLTESQDYVINVLGGAYTFREENLELYGLENETLKNGLVKSDLANLPKPWTGTKRTSSTLQFLIKATRSALAKQWSPDNKGPEAEVLEKLSSGHADLVDVACQSLQECYSWSLTQKSRPDLLEVGEEAKHTWFAHREEMIGGLVGCNQINKAISLAVKHEVMPTLAELTDLQIFSLARTLESEDPNAVVRAKKEMDEMGIMINLFYDRFGDQWATAVYEYYTLDKKSHRILDDPHQKYVTRFLRSRKEFAKIAWIHEVRKEKDPQRCAKILLEIGAHEQDLWSKKVELSIGKLARLSSRKDNNGSLAVSDNGQADLGNANRELALIKIQEQAFVWVLPAIVKAIDPSAEVELALKNFSNQDALEGTKVFPSILASTLAQLVGRKTLDAISLIDLLTLIGVNDGREFYLALKALHQSALPKEEKTLTERVIWRRCLIRNDWSEVNNTVLKADSETAANLEHTALFCTLKACFEDSIFSTPTSFQPVSPSDILGTCTEPSELGIRFADQEELSKIALAADMKTEDDKLEGFMRTCQLEKWWQECVTLAKEEVDRSVHAKTVEGAEMKLAQEEVEALEGNYVKEKRMKALKRQRKLAELHFPRPDSRALTRIST